MLMRHVRAETWREDKQGRKKGKGLERQKFSSRYLIEHLHVQTIHNINTFEHIYDETLYHMYRALYTQKDERLGYVVYRLHRLQGFESGRCNSMKYTPFLT